MIILSKHFELQVTILNTNNLYNCVQIICIKNCYLKLELLTKDYYYY